MSEKGHPIIVFGRHFGTALGVVRDLGTKAYDVYLALSIGIDELFMVAKSSKYVKKAIRLKPDKNKNVLNRLTAEENKYVLHELTTFANTISCEKPILFPIDDYAMSFLDENYQDLTKNFLIIVHSNYQQGDYIHLMDKAYQCELAVKSGLKIPEEWLIDLKQEINLPPDITYPCFCKPVSSIVGTKKDQKKCVDQSELRDHLLMLKKTNPDRSILVQRFLDIKKNVIILGLCTENEIILSGVVDKIETTKYTSGLGVLDIFRQLKEIDDLSAFESEIKAFLKSTKYIGLFDLEFNITDEGIYFNELNIRPSGVEYCLTKEGINLPAYQLQSLYCTNPDKSLIDNGKYEKIFINENYAIEDYLKNKRSLRDLITLFRRAEYGLIHESNDKKPSKYYYRYYGKQILRKFVRSIL